MQWLVSFCISVLFVLGKLQSTKAAVSCIECTDCPDATDIVSRVDCDMACNIWKNENDEIERGCYDSGSNSMISCALENCNSYPVPVCQKCSTIEDCHEVACDNLNDECYAAKTDDNGVVERGCSGEGSTITNCNGYLCNNQPVPVCQQCSTLEDCRKVACDKLSDACYVSKRDERRGCTSDDFYTANDPGDFHICPSNNCNRLPHCVVCNSNEPNHANCLNDTKSFIQPCELHGLVKEDKNCYRYEASKEQFQLGCTTAQDFPESCETNTCKKCGPDNCNEKEFQSCYVCSDDSGCRTLEQSTSSLTCADYDSTCLTAYNRASKTTTRECTNDLPPSIYGEIFYECPESNCNDVEFPTHLQCYQDTIQVIDYCDSLNATRCFTQLDSGASTLHHGCDTDLGFEQCIEFENCLICDSDGCNHDESATAVECVKCSNAEECRTEPEAQACDQAQFYDGCYMYQGIEGTLVKGCLNELVAEESEAYHACTENEQSCQKCTGKVCNVMHCMSCNSRDDVQCVAGNGNVQYELCPMGDSCRTFVNDEGHTVRGCSSKFDEAICEDTCQEYSEPGSNDGLFPEGATKCYQCTEDCDAVELDQLDYCSRNDVSGCYNKFDGNHIVSRGCLSEEKLDCEHDPTCYECKEGEGCNFIEPWECYNCSDANEEDCLDDDTQICKTILNCAVYIDGPNVIRTCINDLRDCDTTGKCENVCNEEKCNNNDICATLCSGEICNEICSGHQSENKCFRYQNQDQLQMGCIDNLSETCRADEDHCFQCDGNLCNVAELTECFACTDCPTVDGAETILCTNPKDECFTARDTHGEVIRGCSSDSNVADLDDYQTCSGAACNRDIIGKSCYQCSNCTQLQGVLPTSCSIQNFEGCYTVQDLETRTIARGCVSDSEFNSCIEGINCVICDAEECNTDEVRTDTLQCSSCSGKNCSDYTPAELCINSEGSLIDRCVTFSTFDVISFKGCLSDGIPEALESDCYNTQAFCELCDEDYCNTPDLVCFSCSTSDDGIECITNPTNLIDCKANGVCLTYVDDTGHLYRGCSNDQQEMCIKGPLCEPCSESHKCNVQILPEDRISCYQCDGDGCKASELQSADSKPCLVYEVDQECYTYAEDQDMVNRGCTNDLSASVCDNKPCVACNGTNCNNQETVQPNQLSCIQCSSNSRCEGQAFGKTCTMYQLLGRSDQCYTLYFGDLTIEKGCFSDLEIAHPFYEDCLANNDRCAICSENDCNSGAALCYECNSDEDDDCSELISSSQYLAECEAECLTLIDADGYTKRGCVEDFPDACQHLSHCDICQGKLCNKEILPKDRQRCYVCQGSKPECLNSVPGLIKACSLYKPNDECYTRFENSTWVERDCLSSIEEETCDDECVRCDEKGCNDHKAYQSNSLSCVTCEGEACSGMVIGQQCSQQILLGRQDYCYEYKDGEMLSKGCLSDLDESSKIKEGCENSQEELCWLCSQNNCNGDIFNCISCDSSNNPECGGWMKSISPDMLEICENRRCVSYVDAKGFTHKGCSNEETACKPDDDNCSECDDTMCNNAAFPEDRIQCHQCEKCNYLAPSDRPVACSKYSSQESCYTYVIDESIYRGCLSEPLAECTETCLTCNTSGCNDHPYEFDSTLSCIQCSGARICAEKSETQPCEGTVNLGSTDQCYSFSLNGEIIQKGCQRSFPECSEYENCEVCSCDGCNLVSKNSDIISCIVCNGEDCGNEQIEADHCEGKACISYLSKEGIVSRGCLQDFDEFCSSFGSKHETCYKSNCNDGLFPADRIKCYRCEDCDTGLGSLEICPKYVEGDGCYTGIAVDGSTVSRGCISELNTDCTGPLCIDCKVSGCNDENHSNPTTTEDPEGSTTTPEGGSTTPEEGTTTPEDGTTTPEGGTTTPEGGTTTPEGGSTTPEEGTTTPEDGTTTPEGATTTPEGGSTTPEGGTTTPEEGTTTPEGSLTTPEGGSTTPEEGTTTPEDGTTTPEGATTTVATTTTTSSSLACIICTGSIDSACAWGFRTDSAEQCPTDAESGCFTCKQDDNRIVRGCSSEQSQSACRDDSIQECAEPGCNNASQHTQKCAICDGNCASYKVEECAGIIEYDNRGCYLMRSLRKIVVKRGCVSKLNADERSDCDNSRDECVICYSDGCNTATLVRVLNGMIAAAIVVALVRSELFKIL